MAPGVTTREAGFALEAGHGHRWTMLARLPARPRATLLWLPALGVSARHYLPLADSLAGHGVATWLHEWRGLGSSSLRADRDCNWGYRELLCDDLPAAVATMNGELPDAPRIIGGHSLGGQLACCLRAMAPDSAQRLWLVGSGAPWWRAFPFPHRLGLPLAYRLLPWLADRYGALPGRRIRFGGNEARGVMHDWALTARTGRYAARGVDTDLESALARVQLPVQAVVLEQDWLAPESSLRFLIDKLGPGERSISTLDEPALGIRADHFAWMQQPAAVARTLVTGLDALA